MLNITFSPFPTLTTERLTLSQLSTDDGKDIFALRSDVEINKYLNRAPSKTIEDAFIFIEKINANIKNNNSIYWAISLTATKTFVGTICLFDFSSENNSCEIGYELITKFQGQGIMTEAIIEVINYGFNTLQFQKIVAFTHTANQNSTKLLTKSGFLIATSADNETPDLSIYNLTRS